ncbi:hypothetical protein [Haloplanus halophilus]|uniref:hypothetical protein n=1 Tax=Haloplanus halophilus TaxID=2949993 RepID=UPI00203F2342|nr:hypothetical protein [Haloplanus sp. GDY1]
MLIENRDELVADLRATADGGLRVVAEYDSEGYDAFYVRDDVAPRLADRADEIHDDLVLQGIGREHLERLFDAGSLHCSMHRFDEVTAFHFVAAAHTGLFVSVDSDADVPLSSFAGLCKARLP